MNPLQKALQISFIKKFLKPLVIIVILWLISVALELFSKQGIPLLEPVLKINYLAILFVLAWFTFKVLDLLLTKTKPKSSIKSAENAIKKVIQLVVYSVLALYGLQVLGVNISNLLAVGGVAGLAAGLAAKDMLGNVFGGLMLYLDRPFSEGDWIRSPDRAIEGTVKKIGIRITQIETFENRPLYVPNSTFTNIVVENPSRMKNRRILQNFSLRYMDLSKAEKIILQIENYLNKHEGIDKKLTLMVNVLQMSESSIDCQIYCFTKTKDWKIFRNIQQEIVLQTIKIVEKNGGEIPFPTRTIEFSQTETEQSPQPAQRRTIKKTVQKTT